MFQKRTLFLSSLLLLSSCSSMMDGSMQKVSYVANGASDARCTIVVGDNSYKYTVSPPQTIWIYKSAEDMNIDCSAQGGRMARLKVKSVLAGSTFTNVLNGTLGAVYDAETGAMFKYPSEVVIDFGGQVAQSEPMPVYENTDALQPDHISEVEYLGPDTIGLAEDKRMHMRHKMAEMQASQEEQDAAAFDVERTARMSAVAGDFNGDKGKSKKDITNTPSVVIDKDAAMPVPVLPMVTKEGQEDSQLPSDPHLTAPIFPSTTSF